MGCAFSNPSSAVEDSRESPGKRLSSSTKKKYSELSKIQRHSKNSSSSSRRERSNNNGVTTAIGDAKAKLIEKKESKGSMRNSYDEAEEAEIKKKPEIAVISNQHPGFGKVPKAIQAEQVAAGWPTWLSAAAAEAIDGWLPRRADTFEKLDKIGQGTYSSVYKARDVTNSKFYALKKVRFDNFDVESIKFMAREILVLRRLDHPNVIKLEGLIASSNSCSLYLIFEYMEHDLTGLAARPGLKFTEPQVKCYMQQLLSGLDHCHSRGILHRDIKGSNLLIDNNGILKIADFGLASFYDPNLNLPLTSRVVTLWYRPPELLLGASRYGVAVDLWSTGCILGELYSGKPILPGKTEVEQLHKIFKLCGSPSDEYWSKMPLRHSALMKPPQPYRRCVAEAFKELPAATVSLMEILLSIDPAIRGTADLALKSEFFTTRPHACDPSSLPKYPPSKEIDAKFREEEARRQCAIGGRSQMGPQAIRGTNVYPPIRQDYHNSNGKSHSEVFGRPREDKTLSGFLVDPIKHSREVKDSRREDPNKRVISHSGPLVSHGPRRPRSSSKERNSANDSHSVSSRANLAKLSGLVAARTSSAEEEHQKLATTMPESAFELKQHRPYKISNSRPVDDERACVNESSLYDNGTKANNKIYVSGPLLVSSNHVDQMLKDHDRRIQEFARRSRLDKTRPGLSNPTTIGGPRLVAG